MRGDRAADGVIDRLRLVLARGNQHDALRRHDVADAHGNRLTRHLVRVLEEARVRFDGVRRQRDDVRAVSEFLRRLVEADVTVAPDAQQLNVDAARVVDRLVIRLNICRRVAAGQMDVLLAQVDLAEQMLLHIHPG